MSRKHFVAIAETVRSIENLETRRHIGEMMASLCASSSRNFNRMRFLCACGL